MIQLEVTYPSSSLTSRSTELLSLASSVPIGSKGKVHIVGRNDMATDQRLSISWVVKDPDGVVVEEYSDWQFGHADADGGTHEFISPGQFDLNKEGIYTIAVGLFMNELSPVMVDSYEGALCTTTVEVPPECRIDADCPEGYVCVNGVCVPEEEVEKKFPWVPVAIGAGAVIAIAGLAAAERRR